MKSKKSLTLWLKWVKTVELFLDKLDSTIDYIYGDINYRFIFLALLTFSKFTLFGKVIEMVYMLLSSSILIQSELLKLETFSLLLDSLFFEFETVFRSKFLVLRDPLLLWFYIDNFL